MSEDLLPDLKPGISGAAAYRKRVVIVDVAFPNSPGSVQTLEGHVAYAAGDAIVTGVRGEQWSIAHATFLKKYDPVSPTRAGEAGKYASRPNEVVARQLTSSVDIALPEGRGVLHGDAGAWLVQYGPGDHSVVQSDIFEETYELGDGDRTRA
jgi:hypothetical protein